MPYPVVEQETLFNAGVDIALDISKLVKEAEFYASIGDFSRWHLKLEAIERRMWTKFREKKDAREEIEDLKDIGLGSLKIYLRRQESERKIPKMLFEKVKSFLTEYEKSLIYWRDKFGYGMPVKDDPRFALG